METKGCPGCNKIKPTSEYDVRRFKGRVTLKSRCKDCRKEERRIRKERLSERVIDKEKITKVCTKCKELKSGVCFPINKENNDGLSSWCTECMGIQYKEYMSREEAKANKKEWSRLYHVKKYYGLEKEEYLELMEKCIFCPICLKELKDEEKVVDHCHETNQVRGLLCSRCNFLLGNARDDIEIIEKAIKYLERFE
jgi:hypothetical protein